MASNQNHDAVRFKLVLLAWSEFLYIDFLGVLGFSAIHRAVRHTATRPGGPPHRFRIAGHVVRAMREALRYRFTHTMCLKQSAVVTRMLRRRGVSASLVIGYQLPALRAHAWVEIDGRIVSGNIDNLETYIELDRW